MSNLAKKLQHEEQQHSHQQTSAVPKPVPPRKFNWLSPGERILIFSFGVLFCIGSAFVISKQSDIYQVNKEIQLVESEIATQQQMNGDLEMQISELSRYERIREQAEKLGLNLNENNVKVVQGQ